MHSREVIAVNDYESRKVKVLNITFQNINEAASSLNSMFGNDLRLICDDAVNNLNLIEAQRINDLLEGKGPTVQTMLKIAKYTSGVSVTKWPYNYLDIVGKQKETLGYNKFKEVLQNLIPGSITGFQYGGGMGFNLSILSYFDANKLEGGVYSLGGRTGENIAFVIPFQIAHEYTTDTYLVLKFDSRVFTWEVYTYIPVEEIWCKHDRLDILPTKDFENNLIAVLQQHDPNFPIPEKMSIEEVSHLFRVVDTSKLDKNVLKVSNQGVTCIAKCLPQCKNDLWTYEVIPYFETFNHGCRNNVKWDDLTAYLQNWFYREIKEKVVNMELNWKEESKTN